MGPIQRSEGSPPAPRPARPAAAPAGEPPLDLTLPRDLLTTASVGREPRPMVLPAPSATGGLEHLITRLTTLAPGVTLAPGARSDLTLATEPPDGSPAIPAGPPRSQGFELGVKVTIRF